MSPATTALQRGLIHAIKHALAAWERFLESGETEKPANGSPPREPERKAGR